MDNEKRFDANANLEAVEREMAMDTLVDQPQGTIHPHPGDEQDTDPTANEEEQPSDLNYEPDYDLIAEQKDPDEEDTMEGDPEDPDWDDKDDDDDDWQVDESNI